MIYKTVFMEFGDYLAGFKKMKFFYYLKSFVRIISPKFVFRNRLAKYLNQQSGSDANYVQNRVSFYNKLIELSALSDKAIRIKTFKLKNYNSTYFFDAYEYIRYFDKSYKVDFLFGDITFIPQTPSIVKSRPILGENANSILLNLDKFRHFNFLNDPKSFNNKIDQLVWRGHISRQKPERIKFLEFYNNHHLCNIGNTNSWKETSQWQKNKMSIGEQLNYKFILCLEGVDVATNLKWVMSSNSLAVMPKPKYETWFMEGSLIPDYHYVEINDDYSNLEEKLNMYMKNPNKALDILKNAHDYVNQFKNKEREKMISLLVLEKYFKLSGQTS